MVYARPLIPLLIAMICGIGIGECFKPGIRLIFPLIPLISALLAQRIYRRRTSGILPLLLFFSVGLCLIIPFASPPFPPHHISFYTDTHRYDIMGRIVSPPVRKNARWQFILKTESLTDKRGAFPVCGNIRVTAREMPYDLSVGDRISFPGKIRAIRNFNNPGRFDYHRYMAFKNIWGSAYIWKNKVAVIQKGGEKGIGQRISAVTASFRDQIAKLIERLAVSNEARSVLQAIIIGKRDAVSASLREIFNRSGVGHLLAISGLHIGMVAAAVFFIFERCLSLFRPFLWHAWVKRGAALLSLLPIWGYGWLAGLPPSTQRAEIMITLWLLTFFVHRDKDALNCLAVAAFVILIISPPSLFSVSFQLSFAAVLVILLAGTQSRFPKRRTVNLSMRIRNIIVSGCIVSGAAILGTLPLTMMYFNQISFIGIVSNLLIVPLVGAFVLPIGLVAVAVYPLSPQAAFTGMQLSGFAMDGVLQMIYLCADFPWAAIKTFIPTPLEVAVYYALLGGVMILGRGLQSSCEPLSAILKRRRSQMALIVVVAVLAADIVFWLHQRFWHRDLRITILDVGQGSAALAELPGGACMLIDGGGFSDASVFDIGKNILAPFLRRKRILTLDMVVLSHPDCDHLNGLLYVMENFHVNGVWTNHQAVDTLGYRKFLDIVRAKKLSWPAYKGLHKDFLHENCNVQILYPPADFIDKMKSQKWRDTNNNSMVVKIGLGNCSILFPGDIMKDAEAELIDIAGDRLKSDILVAPHHGSRSSSTRRFLEKVDPKVVIVSCGWRNRFGFPHASVLTSYQRKGYRVFRTDTHGAVSLSTRGSNLRIMTFLGDDREMTMELSDVQNDSILTLE